MIALTTKHQPKRISDFAGLKRAKAIMSHVARVPYASSWIFAGDSGTGKTIGWKENGRGVERSAICKRLTVMPTPYIGELYT